jgi:hypothetical protein
MMKKGQKFSVVLFASFMVFALMFVPGNFASANDDCGCGTVDGAERNKVIADMLKSDVFKVKKEELKEAGYQWNGVANFEVSYNPDFGAYLVAMPLVNDNGELHYFLHAFGTFVGPVPPPATE